MKHLDEKTEQAFAQGCVRLAMEGANVFMQNQGRLLCDPRTVFPMVKIMVKEELKIAIPEAREIIELSNPMFALATFRLAMMAAGVRAVRACERLAKN